MFSEDTTAIPKETSWFGSEEPPSSEPLAGSQTPLATRPMIPLHAHPLYKEDWIGLRSLDEKGGLVFDICEGTHMQIGGCWERLVRKFCGEIVRTEKPTLLV
jgi:palmitoyl-protein thioesterase